MCVLIESKDRRLVDIFTADMTSFARCISGFDACKLNVTNYFFHENSDNI